MTGTSRDIGLTGAGKGSRPRNLGPEFYENFVEIDFFRTDGRKVLEPQRGFTRRGNKLRKVYK